MTVSPYSDGSAYDWLVEAHCFPTCFDDEEDFGKTPESARREHFKDVSASLIAETARRHVEPVSGRSDSAGTRPLTPPACLRSEPSRS